MMFAIRFLVSLSVVCLSVEGRTTAPYGASQNTNLEELEYNEFPRRTEEEAAVLEWGHSAIISALDASVAHFGPQTSQAALLEVECQPVLASPLDGVFKDDSDDEDDSVIIRALANKDEVHGNMVVMTNAGNLTGVTMAKIAKASGAAALLVVNIDEQRPDDIYRLEAHEGADDIDIPVAMISLNSATVLTTATVTPEMSQADIVNNGMPDRVRLYAGGDRPFFEDVEPSDPTLYLIHNLMTDQECDDLIHLAESKVTPLTKPDTLQLSSNSDKFHNVERVLLWQGMLQTPARKQIEERIEQVTGFPPGHYSDFVVDKLKPGAHWKAHYDVHPSMIPMATITVFLSEPDPQGGGSIVYPSCREPVKILPRRGTAVVHHNANEIHTLDLTAIHALLPPNSETVYVARKFVFTQPLSIARRLVLPLFAAPFGGKLPKFLVDLHDLLVEKFGAENGSSYFDKICVFVPLFVILSVAQAISNALQKKMGGKKKVVASTATASVKKRSKTAKAD